MLIWPPHARLLEQSVHAKVRPLVGLGARQGLRFVAQPPRPRSVGRQQALQHLKPTFTSRERPCGGSSHVPPDGLGEHSKVRPLVGLGTR